jgi:hypothetical protein
MNTKKNILLAVTTGIFLVGSSVVNSATVNVNLGVSTADGFTLRDSAGADLTSGSLVKLGVFVNTTSGAQLTNASVQGLYNALSTFNQNTTSILANFIQIGEGKINFGLANGLAGGQLGTEAGATENYLTDPFTFTSERGSGAFNRSWLDNTLSIQDANIGLAPYNSLANTKLVGLQVAAIVFNGSTVDGSTEFLVARNNIATEVLPSESGASVTFSLASGSSDLLVGTAVGSTAFQTIPEPSTMALSLIGSIALLRRRKRTSRLS